MSVSSYRCDRSTPPSACSERPKRFYRHVFPVQTNPGADLRGARRLLSLLQPSGKMSGGGRRQHSTRLPAGADRHYVPAAQDQVRMSRAVYAVWQRHVLAVGHLVSQFTGRVGA